MAKDKSVINTDVLKETIVTEHKSYGEQMNLATFKAFLDVVNRHVPYSSRDFEKHHFIENIATTPEQAAFWRAHGEFCVKAYGN